MNTCKKCNNLFKTSVKIDNKFRNLKARKYCLECSPFGEHNTRPIKDGIVRPKSIFDRIPEEELREIVKNSVSRLEIFATLNLRASGASYKILTRILQEKNIDYSHLNKRRKVKSSTFKYKDFDKEVLIENSPYVSASTLKKRLIKLNILENKCQKCGLGNLWQNETISLQLDHINGIRNDNRLENLRILCPNCHSQTPTFAGKRFAKKTKNNDKTLTIPCPSCNKPYRGYGKTCKSCKQESKIPQIYLKNPEGIIEKLYNAPMIEVASELNISDNGVRKFLKRSGLIPPSFPRGYWLIRKQCNLTHEETLNKIKEKRKIGGA